MPRADLGSVYNHSATIQEIECHNVPFFSGSNPMYLWHNRLLAIKITSFVGNPLATSSIGVHCTQVKANSICFEKKSECWKTVHKKNIVFHVRKDRSTLFGPHLLHVSNLPKETPNDNIFFLN